MDSKLHLYSIMIADVEHIDEICEDIKYQYENGITTCALFNMSLVPEGNPPVNKALALGKNYALFREKLKKDNIPNGILIQSSIGHGYPLGKMFPFQQYFGLVNKIYSNVACPLDEGFREYIYNTVKTLMSFEPDCIMLDDDFRLLHRGSKGCACPLHLKRTSEILGRECTHDEILEAAQTNSPEADRVFDAFVKSQHDSLVETAEIMRKAMDEVNPKTPGLYCCVGENAESAEAIAKALAGKGNPTVVRINNGRYTPQGARYLSHNAQRAAIQIAKLKDKVDVILAETDTCPQNRYSTGAQSLHAQFTASILEGAKGAKHWITRLATHEPQSGKAYRKILSKRSKFYEKLAELTPQIQWTGFRTFVSDKPCYKLSEEPQNVYSNIAWGYCVFERLGLPMYFSAQNDGILCLDGDGDKVLSDAQILEALKGPVILASNTAQNLIKRGFGQYIGADVREWNGKTVKYEKLYVNNRKVAKQMQLKELVPFEDAVADSMVLHSLGDGVDEPLFPGSLIYKNSLGGTVFLFAGTPEAAFRYTEAFSFLTYSRKQQLIRMAKQTGLMPVYYPNDEEMYLRVGYLPENKLFCGLFNIGLDPIEEVEICVDRTVSKIEMLMPDGTFENVSFTQQGEKCVLHNTPCYSQNPVILIIK